MRKKIDRYPELGKKVFVADEDAVLSYIRSQWPDAWQEGSTGPERSWWTDDDDAPLHLDAFGKPAMIGHSWPKQTTGYWVRLTHRKAS